MGNSRYNESFRTSKSSTRYNSFIRSDDAQNTRVISCMGGPQGKPCLSNHGSLREMAGKRIPQGHAQKPYRQGNKILLRHLPPVDPVPSLRQVQNR